VNNSFKRKTNNFKKKRGNGSYLTNKIYQYSRKYAGIYDLRKGNYPIKKKI